jgi:hypothetical protein
MTLKKRDDLVIVSAMLNRTEASVNSLRQEMSALHCQIARMNDRVRKLEDQGLISRAMINNAPRSAEGVR